MMMDKRMGKLDLLRKELQEPEHIGSNDPEVLLLGWGSMSGPLKEAVSLLSREEEKRFAALVFGDVWPLPQQRLMKLAANAKALINVEQNYTGQLGGLIRERTGLQMNASILNYDGRQLSGAQIADRVKREGY